MSTSLAFPLRLGTRGSTLALTQAAMVRTALATAHGLAETDIEIVPLRTTGDRVQDRALAEIGGKALWTKELDRALADGAVDFCVHSMKDVETIRPAEIAIAAMLPRADPRDRLIGAASIAALPQGALVGTSSPRRAAQLRHARPDLRITLFRGNVETRLAKLAAGEVDATLLAAAGLDRLGKDAIGTSIPIETMLPAASQAAIGVETLAARTHLRTFLAAIDDADTHGCVAAERALLAALGADCQSPVAAHARPEDGRLRLDAEILSADGRERVNGSLMLDRDAPDAAAELAQDLLARAAPSLRALFDG